MSRFYRPKGLDEGSHVVCNTYECPCGNVWEDEWDSGCDDECGACGADVSPSQTEDHPDCDCEECQASRDSDRIVLRTKRGWMRDADGWWLRPVYRRDIVLVRRCARDYPRSLLGFHALVRKGDAAIWAKLKSREGLSIGTGYHAFVVDGMLYCRNTRQQKSLDHGTPV